MISYVEQLVRHFLGLKTSIIYLDKKWKISNFSSFSVLDRNSDRSELEFQVIGNTLQENSVNDTCEDFSEFHGFESGIFIRGDETAGINSSRSKHWFQRWEWSKIVLQPSSWG